MLEHQANPAEQTLLMPLVHLREHLVFFGVDPFGECLIGTREPRQPTFQVSTQGQCLCGTQRRVHGLSPRAKPRSMR